MSDKLAPFRLAPWFSERVWGRLDLTPWYDATGTTERVGEAWLTGPESLAETGICAGKTLAEIVAEHGTALLGGVAAAAGTKPEFPILVKMLFPEQKLSVQVHPDDEQARALGQPRGKTECWYVLEAEPGAAVALGLKEGSTPERVRSAVADGSMEELMQWLPVSAGDMVFVDAGTVHAIGPGVVLLETQQTSDTTFRLYDYGRPRELHLDEGLRVMKAQTQAGKVAARQMDGFVRLIEQTYFCVDRYEVKAAGKGPLPAGSAACLVALQGSGVVIGGGPGMVEMVPGRAVVLPASADDLVVESAAGVSFVRCFAP